MSTTEISISNVEEFSNEDSIDSYRALTRVETSETLTRIRAHNVFNQ